MKAIRFEGQNAVFGAPRDWDEAKSGPCGGLPIKRSEYRGTPTLTSYWRPSEEDIANILAGYCVRLTVFGEGHPPVSLDVEAVEEKT